MDEIARIAGVSKATVSRVVNQKSRRSQRRHSEKNPRVIRPDGVSGEPSVFCRH